MQPIRCDTEEWRVAGGASVGRCRLRPAPVRHRAASLMVAWSCPWRYDPGESGPFLWCPMAESLAGSFVLLGLMPLTLGGLAVAYLALRIRDARAEPPDPQVGFKAAAYSFLTTGILLALSGVS